ncbi:MAG: hypothetical protein MUF73_16610 [Rhodobacteraceae bacterium]|nr:hypothetical protein [Paracoccaceae bacterium]
MSDEDLLALNALLLFLDQQPRLSEEDLEARKKRYKVDFIADDPELIKEKVSRQMARENPLAFLHGVVHDPSWTLSRSC